MTDVTNMRGITSDFGINDDLETRTKPANEPAKNPIPAKRRAEIKDLLKKAGDQDYGYPNFPVDRKDLNSPITWNKWADMADDEFSEYLFDQDGLEPGHKLRISTIRNLSKIRAQRKDDDQNEFLDYINSGGKPYENNAGLVGADPENDLKKKKRQPGPNEKELRDTKKAGKRYITPEERDEKTEYFTNQLQALQALDPEMKDRKLSKRRKAIAKAAEDMRTEPSNEQERKELRLKKDMEKIERDKEKKDPEKYIKYSFDDDSDEKLTSGTSYRRGVQFGDDKPRQKAPSIAGLDKALRKEKGDKWYRDPEMKARTERMARGIVLNPNAKFDNEDEVQNDESNPEAPFDQKKADAYLKKKGIAPQTKERLGSAVSTALGGSSEQSGAVEDDFDSSEVISDLDQRAKRDKKISDGIKNTDATLRIRGKIKGKGIKESYNYVLGSKKDPRTWLSNKYK